MGYRLNACIWVCAILLTGCLCADGFAGADPGDLSTDNIGLGYLTAPSLAPGHILRPSSMFVLPELGPKGTDRLDCDFHWGNVWNNNPEQFTFDGEWIRSAVRYSHALKDTLAVGVALPVIGRSGGFADPLIEDFHRAVGMGNASREQYPQNRSLIAVHDQNSVETVAEGDSWGIGDVSAFMAARLTGGTAVLPAITVQCEVSLPTGDQDELRGLGAASVAVSAVASKRLGESPFISYFGAGFEYCDSANISVIELRDEQYTGMAGLEYQYSRSFGLLLQYLINSPVAKDYYAFSESSQEVSFGCKWRVGSRSSLEMAVVENVDSFENSADIGFHLAYGCRL